jgi:hypothetical protein
MRDTISATSVKVARAHNVGKAPEDWQFTCMFITDAPEQNPVEDIWLFAKRFIRICTICVSLLI